MAVDTAFGPNLIENTLPFLSYDFLAKSYRQRAEELSKDIDGILPEWARNGADQLFKKKKFVVCGTSCWPEIKMLAKNADILAIVDDTRPGTRLFGIPVVDTDSWIRFARRNSDLVSCVLVPSCAGFQHFVRQCIQWELPFLDPFQYLHLLKLHHVDMTGVAGRLTLYGYEFSLYAVKHYEKLLKLAERLDDEYSRISWLCILLYRITWNPFYLAACSVGYHSNKYSLNSYSVNRQFFKFSDDEVYIDTGAYTGDTIEYFLRAVKGKFKHLYSFEPSADNNRQIRARLNALQSEFVDSLAGKITLYEKGVWNCEDVLRFNPCTADIFDVEATVSSTGFIPNTGTAHIVGAGLFEHMYDRKVEDQLSIKMPVTTIDKATNQDATFIKFEIEGSELMALQGAAKTLERNRRKLALSIYHKPDDFVTLFEHVLNLDLGYKFGFRQHHALIPDNMVLYCYR